MPDDDAPRGPLFLLDNNLNPRLAQALRLAGYNVLSVQEAFQVAAHESVKDQVLIPWCQENQATWVTVDLAARKDHEAQLKTAQINVIWLRRPKQGLNSRQQLRILSRALEYVEAELEQHRHRVMHWEIGWQVGASIKPSWERRRR